MNFLLSAVGSAGDVHPIVGLGRRLKDRGHTVSIITNPYFSGLVERCGLELIPMGTVDEFMTLVREADLWHPTRSFRTVIEGGVLPSLRVIYDAVATRYVPGELVVGAHSLDFGSRLAQEKLGVPVATIHLAPAVFRSIVKPPVLPMTASGDWVPRWYVRFQFWLADKLVVDPVLATGINEFRRELGLPPVQRVFDKWWSSPDRVIGMFPDWFGPKQIDWPPQTVLTGFPLWDESELTQLAGPVADFLNAGDPPIVFSPGSAMVRGQDFFTAAIDACSRLGRRGMLLTKFPEQIPTQLPAGVRHFDFVPFSQVLPQAAAFVHHGGIGSLSQGLAAGVPHLVMPMAHDQPDNAARLKRLGVGDWLLPKHFRGPAVAVSLARLIGDTAVRESCRLAADRIRHTDGLGLAADEMERLASLYSSRSA